MFTPIQAQTQVCFALYFCLYYHENDTNFAPTSMKPLIYRKKTSFLLKIENVCICVCVRTFLDSKDRVCFLSRFLLFMQQQ